jgi:hypothetical protein
MGMIFASLMARRTREVEPSELWSTIRTLLTIA